MLVLKIAESDAAGLVVKALAEFRCPCCNKSSHLSMISKKLVGEGRGKLSWCISNFQAHFRKHFKALQSDRDQQSMQSFIFKGNVDRTNVSNIVVDKNITEIIDDESEIDEVVGTIPRKRKFNVISDDEDGAVKASDPLSGECLPGELKGQNTPSGKTVPQANSESNRVQISPKPF